MALTRSFLKGMSLTDEQISAIIDAHIESTDALKKQRDDYKADAEKLTTVQKELDTLKGGKDWKAEFDKEHQAFEAYKADVAGKEMLAAKQAAYRKLLTAENIPEKFHDRIIKMTDFSGIEMDGETIKDEAGQRDNITKEWGEYKGTVETHGATVETPPSTGNTPLTRADIFKKDEKGHYLMSTAERQRAIAETLK